MKEHGVDSQVPNETIEQAKPKIYADQGLWKVTGYGYNGDDPESQYDLAVRSATHGHCKRHLGLRASCSFLPITKYPSHPIPAFILDRE